MRRFGLCLAVAIGAMLLAALPAAACNFPKIYAGPSGAVHPGDTVSYQITDLSSGAEYAVYVERTQVTPTLTTTADGTVEGTFEMPDMGDFTHDVSVEAEISHGDIENPGQAERPNATPALHYTVASAPAAGSPQQDASAPTGEPAPGSQKEAAPQGATTSPAPPAGPAAGGGPRTTPNVPRGQSPQTGLRQRARGEPVSDRRASAPPLWVRQRRPVLEVRAAAAAPVGVIGRRPRPSLVAAWQRLTPSHERRAVAAVRAPLERLARAPGSASGRAVAADVSEPSQRTALGIIVGFLVAGMSLALVLRRGRFGTGDGPPGPDPPPPAYDAGVEPERDLAIEAELQEMIAEGRAHEATDSVAKPLSPVR